jgi:hypothetical protein
MHRRPLGRGRVLALAAAAILLGSCLLPWFAVGGDGDLPTLEQRAFDGPGIVVFLAALLIVAIVALPYAAGDRPVAIDAWPIYLLLLAAAAIGVALWPLLGGRLDFPAGLLPAAAPGWWLAILGVIVLARAVFEIHLHPVQR